MQGSMEALAVLGVTCLILAPVLFVVSLVLLIRLGSAISRKDPELWSEMKPGFYSDIRVSNAHDRRFTRFLRSREYLQLNDPTISRLAVLLRRASIAGRVAMYGGIAVVLWSLL